MSPARRLLPALLAAATACAGAPVRIELPDRPRRPADAAPLVFAGGAAAGLWRPDGRSCPRPPPAPRRGLVGWSPQGEELSCQRDTLDHGVGRSSLELRFRAAVAADGRYQLLSRGLTVDAWGRAVARGGPYGEYVARAWLELVARAPSCSATHTLELGRAQVTGPWDRVAAFSGWITLPDLVLEGCRANEVLEVRLRLVGEVNRGRVEVESFGVVASREEELQDAFALRRLPDAPPPPPAPSSP